MADRDRELLDEMAKKDPQRAARLAAELAVPGTHALAEAPVPNPFEPLAMNAPQGTYVTHIRSLDELLERDRQREKDGFPRKIRVGRLIKPGASGKDKVVIVPTSVEEKFYHDNLPPEDGEGGSAGGTGEGEEGEVIGEQPVHAPAKPETGEQARERGKGTRSNRAPTTWARSSLRNSSCPTSRRRGRNAP